LQPKGKFVLKLPENDMEYLSAINACLDPTIPLVSITGRAGSGKSTAAMASLVQLWQKEPELELILVKENILSTANSLGYVKGSIEEKKEPIFKYIESVLNFINKNTKVMTMRSNSIRTETIGYLLGETFSNAYIIVDEAQNLTPQNIDLLVTRVGKNAKIIFVGDTDQNYNRSNKLDNGLTYLNNVMNGSGLYTNIKLLNSSLRSVLVQEFLDRRDKYLFEKG
jgi:PhoH-like ATPase